MTVLQVCAYAAPYEGNFITSLRALAAALSEKGHSQIYAFPETAKEIPWVAQLALQAPVYYLPLAKARLRAKTYQSLSTIFKEHPEIGVVHSHFELYDVPVALTAPKNVKVFWHLHDALEMYSDRRSRAIHKVQYGLLHKKAVLLSVSQKHMKYVQALGFPKKRSFFVPNGLDTDRIHPVSEPFHDRPYDFLIFGWEYKRKGVDLCVNAVENMEEKPVVAVVAESTPEIMPENMHCVPPTKDINRLYASAKCFLHISRAEGLSYALLEAVYAGLPVICSNIPENLFASIFPTVTMVQNEDVVSIRNAMQVQLRCDAIGKEAVAESQSIIEREFSIQTWVSTILKHYGVI